MTTIVCSDCTLALSKEDFSKSQLKKKATKTRRCLSCARIVDDNSNSNSNSDNNPCYHGCTKQEFNNCGKFFKILESYDNECDTPEKKYEFYKEYKHVLLDPSFGRFAIARVTDDYLKDKNHATRVWRLLLMINIRYCYIPMHEGKDIGPESENMKKIRKSVRDTDTERSTIKLIAREIPCDCMEEKRIAAKSMEKNAVCFECRKEFSKEQMLRCLGCDYVQYCSIECQTKNWPAHKAYCGKPGVSSATPLPPVSVPSSYGELSDVDAND